MMIKIGLQAGQIFLSCAIWHLSIQMTGCKLLYHKRNLSNQTSFLKVHNKQAMISYSISCWHNTCMVYHHILCCPYAIDWFGPLKESRATFFPVKSPTTSDIFRPSLFVKDCSSDFLLKFHLRQGTPQDNPHPAPTSSAATPDHHEIYSLEKSDPSSASPRIGNIVDMLYHYSACCCHRGCRHTPPLYTLYHPAKS